MISLFHKKKKIKTFTQKIAALYLLVAILIPQQASAYTAALIIENLPAIREAIIDKINEGISTAAAVGVKNGTRAFLEKIAYDSAVALTSGCEFQGPCINYKEFNLAIDDAGDAAVGEFLNTVATQNGFVNLNLCDLPEYEQLELNLLLPELTGKTPYEPSCTLSEIREEVGDYSNDLQLLAATFVDDPTALTTLTVGTMEGENALSSLLVLIDEQMGLEADAERQQELEQAKSDFKGIEAPISGYVKTPAAVLEYQTQATYTQAVQAELTLTGNPIADALSVFTNTLAKRLLDQTSSGLLSFYTDPSISDSVIASGAGRNSSTSGSREAARERFANLQTPSFRSGGELDVLNEFTSCPEVGVTSTNCVIGQNMRRAIEEKMTLAQATDAINGPLISRDTPFVINADGTPITDYESGFNKRSIAILQSYGVVPSTWTVAAQYNEEFDGTAKTLGQLMDEYDDLSSPYYGLVNPDWVLKAPEVFCKVEGYGNTFAVDEYVDSDGSPNTPDERIVNRLNSCVDEQTCLSEDASGNCEAYGYCTKYEDTYRFAGEECPAQFASCNYYSNSSGDSFGVLTNTINSADCSDSTIGCQWACGVYNSVDEAFQCASQDTIYTTCTTEEGCSCAADDGSSCSVQNGGFFCTTDTGVECTIGVDNEDDVSEDAAITFDSNAQTCSESDAGCSEFISIKNGANLLFNYSFEAVNDVKKTTTEEDVITATITDTAADQPFDDSFGFYGESGDGTDGSLAGEPCSASTDPQTCYGWEFSGGATARAVLDALDGAIALQLEEGSGFIEHRFDTGHALGSRTFTLNFSYMNPTANTCSGEFWVAPNGDREAYAQPIDFGTSAGTFATEFPSSVTFPSDVSATTIAVGFSQASGCQVVLDAIVLVEDVASSGIVSYGNEEDLTYVNTAKAVQCEPNEVGCTEFTPESGESDFVINGQITNPLSDECGNGSDYSNPACSQCIEEFVGCDAYIESPTPYAAPVNNIDGFASAPSEQIAEAVAQRSGLYCDGTTDACNTDADCSSGVSCLPSVSIVPEASTSCSATAVGCEEYVNLDTVAQGGEGKEYYTYIQQCVSPTQAQIDGGEIDFYYTFEGTESGYQLRSHYLKVSDDGSGAPCTNIDQFDYTGTSETTEADCVDRELGPRECDPSTDTDCVQYYDSNANTYFRKTSEVIEVSDSCIGARNTLDGRVYSILPEKSTSCRASENLCREYKGSEGNSAQPIIEDDFESTVWSGGTSSGESLSVDTGLSMLVTNAQVATYDMTGRIEQDQNYVMEFWAKGDGGTLNAYFTSGSLQIPFETDGIVVNDEWRVYRVGPVIFENDLAGNEVLTFEYSGSNLYIDTLLLSESGSQYLLSDSLVTCNGYEGCEEYTDTEDTTHYLKSFSSLCDDDAVGCQALIDTNQDADNPYYTVHNTANEYNEDDVAIVQHEVVTLAVTDDSLCDAENAGCQAFGTPSFDASENITSSVGYTKKFVINDPDTYDTALCQEQQRWCDAWTADDDESIIYAKNFGERYCEYDSSLGEWITSEGQPCPLQNENASPSQPKGSVCNGGLRSGQMCQADSDCPDETGTSGSYRCVSYDNSESGWAGLCSNAYAQCTLYLDPNTKTEVPNHSFELDQFDNDDYSSADQDDQPDYWEIFNEGVSGTKDSEAATPQKYRSSDILNVTVSDAPDSQISFWHEDDIPPFASSAFSSGSASSRVSGTIAAGSTSFSDQNSGNSGISRGTMIGTTARNWSGMSQNISITAITNSTSASSFTSSIAFTFPALPESALQDDYLFFHIADNGSLYWADEDNNGVKSDGSDFLTPEEAITDEHLVVLSDVAVPLEVNGFYDARDLDTSIDCRAFEAISDGFIGEYSVAVQALKDTCMVGTKSLITIDPNTTYTLRAKVKAENTNAQFALGLLFYDATGEEIYAGSEPADYAFAAFEGPGRDDSEALQANTWVDYHGDIGVNLKTSFPEGTYYVRVFTEASDSAIVYFDEIQLNKNAEYTYIENSVDTTSCNGVIDIANGCVPFRNTNNDQLTQLSSGPQLQEKGVSFTTQSCTFNSPLANVACQLKAFGADTNAVIAVDQDRECSQWLACTDGEPIYNSSGDLEQVVCYDVGLCTKRNPETGACTQWAPNKNASDIQSSDELSTQLSDTDTLALYDIQTASSHAQIGGFWNTGECSDGTCTAGRVGDACSTDNDCHPEVDGYYPYNWLPYRGLGGSLSGVPLITNGDFEEVHCEGDSTSSDSDYDSWGVERSRDSSLSCTRDTHCRTLETDAALEQYLAQNDISDSVESITYENGWCSNVAEDVWNTGGNTWSTENASMTIIDYNPGESQRFYDKNNGVSYNPVSDGIAAGVAAGDLNLDNYMYVVPEAGQGSYIVVELDASAIIDGQEYTIQFNGGHTGPAKNGDYLDIFLQHGSGALREKNSIVAPEDQERFEQGVRQYTFGPIIADKSNSSEKSYLYIGLSDQNEGTGFVIDDVMVNSTLELNGDELIGRECRAYPEEESLQCEYTETENDTIHQGWQGFCTVRDPFDSSKCITWFPVDSIPGEPNFSAQNLLFWNGHFPVNYCLAAKGNESLGACSGSGEMCLSDFGCASGETCIGGTDSDLFTTDSNLDVNVDADEYSVTIELDELIIDKEPHVRGTASRTSEKATFVKLTNTDIPLLKNMHISEIDNIQFDLGDPSFNFTDPNDLWEVNNVTTFNLREMEIEEIEETEAAKEADGYNMFEAGSEDDPSAIITTLPTETKGLTYAYQRGVWCDKEESDFSGLCISDSLAKENVENLGFYFVKGITKSASGSDTTPETNIITQNGGILNEGKPLNPFIAFDELASTSSIWDDGYLNNAEIEAGSTANSAQVEGVEFDGDYFFNRYYDNSYSCMNRSSLGCGANIAGFYVDVQDGYINAIYLMYWNGFHDVDTEWMDDVRITFDLREVCLAATEVIDENAMGTPWWQRATTGAGYSMKDTSSSYTMGEFPTLYGRMDDLPTDDGKEVNFSDEGDFSDLTLAADNNFPLVYYSDSSMKPLACIGSCGDLVCEDDRSAEFDRGDACESEWVGAAGVCEDDPTQVCTSNVQCPSFGTCNLQLAQGDGVVPGGGQEYYEQLNTTVDEGWNRLRLVFADLSPDRNIWFAPQADTSTGKYKGFLQEMLASDVITDFCGDDCDAFANVNGRFDFDVMEECSDGTRENDEYCGIRPTIENVRLQNKENGAIEITHGQTLSLEFDTNTNDEQEPLQTVMIDWEADPSAGFNANNNVVPFTRETADGTVRYTHVYTCNPTQGDTVINGGEYGGVYCLYKTRIQIQDNWGFCSGNENKTVIRDNCTSYDEYQGDIIVRP